MKKAFTLIELVVAVAILAIVFIFAGLIFRVSINSYRTAVANAEIMQKLRAITDQLNSDFGGLRKDGEIFVIWKTEQLNAAAAGYDDYHACDNDNYERFDRIMFFADGDFQSYKTYNGEPVRGNTARICYMLAKTKDENGNWQSPEYYREPTLIAGREEQGRKLREEDRRGRILSRTQHTLTADPDTNDFLNLTMMTSNDWYEWNNICEYDKTSLDEWKNIPRGNKADILTVITDVNVFGSAVPYDIRGTKVDPADANTIHNLLCEGVGEFKVQGWYDAGKRWVPDVDPDGDGNFNDSEFVFTDPSQVPGIIYPYRVPASGLPYGLVSISGEFNGDSYQRLLNEARFNEIPGLGRALKFTFTLYDSKGFFKKGRTFTHIVYLGD